MTSYSGCVIALTFDLKNLVDVSVYCVGWVVLEALIRLLALDPEFDTYTSS